jgi:phosphonoacetate hydrolase
MMLNGVSLSVHGICGNYFGEPDANGSKGAQVMMLSEDSVRGLEL